MHVEMCTLGKRICRVKAERLVRAERLIEAELQPSLRILVYTFDCCVVGNLVVI